MKNLLLRIASFVVGTSTLLANGGAWQTGVPGTGSASATNKNQKTAVTIANEALKIDLHPEYAAVEVRYRMHNTGPKAQQDFFFPVERWGKNPDADIDAIRSDIDHYQISCNRQMWPDPRKKAAKRKKEPAMRTRKAAKRREKAAKRLRGSSGNKSSPRSSHGRNR
jgi:hypothetical protein